eukprot:5942506-Pyramimonas_sp.AAC.2
MSIPACGVRAAPLGALGRALGARLRLGMALRLGLALRLRLGLGLVELPLGASGSSLLALHGDLTQRVPCSNGGLPHPALDLGSCVHLRSRACCARARGWHVRWLGGLARRCLDERRVHVAAQLVVGWAATERGADLAAEHGVGGPWLRLRGPDRPIRRLPIQLVREDL